MSSFIFGSNSVNGETVEDVKEIVKHRYGKEPAIYRNEGVFIASSRDDIDQGDVKVAFDGYLLKSDVVPEKYIAELYRKHGKEFVKRLEGQFRVILYDEQKERFHTSADKIGKKVIYFSREGGKFVCSSHLSPILRHESIEVELSEIGASDFLQGWSASFGGGERLIKNVKRLYPSHFLTFSQGNLDIELFWDTPNKNKKVSDEKAVQKMDELLTEAAEKLVEKDSEPFNVFLSGGFDSTFLVALLREVTDKQVNTFTWGWEENHFESAREMSEKFGTNHHEIQNQYSFPSDEEIYFYEEPQNAFVRYPFRELYREHDVRGYWTGLNSQATFPVCLKNIRKLDRLRFTEPIVKRIPTRKLKSIASRIDYQAAKGIEVIEGDSHSTSAVIDWGASKHDYQKLVSSRVEGRDLDKFLDKKWGLREDSYQENYSYLQLRTRDTARYAYYSQDLDHFDVYGYRPLVEFSYSLPMSQKKNRRLLQKVARGRVPDKIITKGASGWEFVSEQFRKTIEHNRSDYRSTIEDFIDRGIVDKNVAEEMLLREDFDLGKGRINELMSIYLLERWMKIFIDRDEPWKPIS